jgi:hypothetical protein
MFDIVCYVLAVVLFGLAALLPATVPSRDRIAYAGLFCFALPSFYHAAKAHG